MRIRLPSLKRHPKDAGADPSTKGDTATLVGRSVYLSLDDERPKNMTWVKSLSAQSPLRMGRARSQLHIYVDDEVTESKGRVKLMAEGYLRLGLWRSHRTRKVVVMLGGEQDETGTNLLMMVFQSGKLKDVAERFLPPSPAIDFDDLVRNTIQSIRETFPECSIEQCHPLPEWKGVGIDRYHGPQSPLLRFIMPTRLAPGKGLQGHLMIPLLVVVAGAGYYAYTVGTPYLEYRDAHQVAERLQLRMTRETSNRISLDVLQAQSEFVRQERDDSQVLHVDNALRLAGAIHQIPAAQIQRIEMLPKIAQAETGIRSRLDIVVPSNTQIPALEQGRDVLGELSRNSGMSMRLSRQRGISERGATRAFVVEVVGNE
ncbi:hypothetical protein VRRI112168_00260 [Vreelandella rituensis]|uniref:Uncharacterized protein n=1 Tax=Vreelandella rituensis TaxID=2282306 RepID=A0A368U9G9_9GAMM|nr:hypothetical protein [Halomonas rituensis]RCV93869.1 hypothetical protein DU506_01545 [Halomonas rituensis]